MHKIHRTRTRKPAHDVPRRVTLGKTVPQPLAWGTTAVIWETDPENSHPSYESPFTSWADLGCSIKIEKLQRGDSIQVSYEVHDTPTGKPVRPWDEVVWSEVACDTAATKPVQYVGGTSSKKLTKGQHVYVAIKVTAAPGDTSAAFRDPPKAVSGRFTIRQDKS